MRDTICAVSTPSGEGGIAVARMSGARALEILKAMFRATPAGTKKPVFKERLMRHGWILDARGEVLDEVMAVWMRAPRSYTGEDVCEVHCHGGEAAVGAAIKRMLELGARAAEPGEFTRRAFESGKIDLARAEAVMSMISARGELAARAAARQLSGGASAFVEGVYESLRSVCAGIEAANDFPDEIDETEAISGAREGIARALSALRAGWDERGSRILASGASVVLAGRPNVGKSSIMNAVAGAKVSIVTDEAGTTRDVVTRRARVRGVDIELSDTAGLREATGKAETEGVSMARRAAREADVVVLVLDTSRPLDADERALLAAADEKYIVCVNKSDKGQVVDKKLISALYSGVICETCAITGEGVDALCDEIARRARPAETPLTLERHVAIAREAAESLEEALTALDAGYPMDVAGACAQSAMTLLSRITGTDAREDVIDDIFKNFCVGK